MPSKSSRSLLRGVSRFSSSPGRCSITVCSRPTSLSAPWGRAGSFALTMRRTLTRSQPARTRGGSSGRSPRRAGDFDHPLTPDGGRPRPRGGSTPSPTCAGSGAGGSRCRRRTPPRRPHRRRPRRDRSRSRPGAGRRGRPGRRGRCRAGHGGEPGGEVDRRPEHVAEPADDCAVGDPRAHLGEVVGRVRSALARDEGDLGSRGGGSVTKRTSSPIVLMMRPLASTMLRVSRSSKPSTQATSSVSVS